MNTGRTFEQAFEENFMGEWDLFLGVVELFETQYKVNTANLSAAIAADNRKSVKEVAHKIKGSVSHFHHDRPVELANHMEKKAAELTKAELESFFNQLETALEDLRKDLADRKATAKVSGAA